MHADEKTEISSASAGEIVALRGLKEVQTGDTLSDPKHPIVLEGIAFPETVVSQAIEPKTAAERDRLLECLNLLAREDPTFNWRIDEDTGQIIINGMGELHLEVLVHRLVRDWKIQALIGKPRVWYRQTVSGPAEAQAVFEKEFGTRRHFAALRVRVEPDPSRLKPSVEIKLDPKLVPREFWPSIDEGIKGAVESGGHLGFPWIKLKVIVINGEARIGESSHVAFSAAAAEAFQKACEAAGSVLLEPIMRFDIFIPMEYYGPVSTDLTARRAEIHQSRILCGGQRLEGTIPLSETFGYANTLRSLTQGRGTVTLEPCGFAPAPADVVERFLV